MSHFYATYFVLIYSVFIVCTDGLNVKHAHTRLIRESLQNDLRSHRNHSPNIWGKNQTSLFVQENKELSEGWIAVENWPTDSFKLGQVSGVSLDAKGHVYVFHRGDRVWDLNTFDINNRITLNERHRGPISIPTIIIYDSVTGKVLQKWGENMFYMPHGITVDRDDNIWATDVALHQVFKYSPLKSNPGTAQLTLGEAFVPGNDAAHFCKPTSIAVTSWGDFFVADGYCNSRIVKFDKNGVKLIEWGRSNSYSGIGQPPDYMFNVPHALSLAEDKGMLCVADRENGRVQCFNVHNSTTISKFNSPCVGARLFSVAYSPVQGGLFFVVNGMEERQFNAPIRGCVLSAKSDKDLYKFGENKLQNPHDIAVSSDGRTLFVVEIGPFKLWKYQSNDVVNNFLSGNNVSVSSVQSVLPSESLTSVQSPDEPQQLSAMTPSGILPAILVTSAALIFAGALLTAAIVYSRARRRGCGHCGDQGWMLGRNSAEGFKLSHFLGQHQGFQKVNTGEESEEEEEVVPFA